MAARASSRGARTTTFVNREAKQPAWLKRILAALAQIVVERPKVQARAVGQAPRQRTEPHPLDEDQLIALFGWIAKLGKHRGSTGLAKAARTAKGREVRDLKALAVAMHEQHARLHRLLDVTGEPCVVSEDRDCGSAVATVNEHARIIRQIRIRAGLEEALLATFSERIPRFGFVLKNFKSKERRRVDELPSLLAALRDLGGLEPVDLGFLRAAIDASFRLPISEDAEAVALHTVHQALYVWDHPPRDRSKESGMPTEAPETPDSQ